MMKTFYLKQYVAFWGALVFLLGLMIPAPLAASGSAQSTSIDTEKIAEQLWQGFQRAVWSSHLQDWSGAGGAGSGSDCRELQSNSGHRSADELWCNRCTEKGENHLAEWSFYAFDLDGPPGCRLQQFHGYAKQLPIHVLDEVHRILESRLTGEYGAGELP